MLGRCGESDHPCLFLFLKLKYFCIFANAQHFPGKMGKKLVIMIFLRKGNWVVEG